jgi:hypothetical protein
MPAPQVRVLVGEHGAQPRAGEQVDRTARDDDLRPTARDAVGHGGVHSDAGATAGRTRVRAAAALRAGRPADTHRWVSHAVDWTLRLATVAAGRCPALASLGGRIVAALPFASGWCVDRHGWRHPPTAR